MCACVCLGLTRTDTSHRQQGRCMLVHFTLSSGGSAELLRSGHHLGKLYTGLLKFREEAVAKSVLKYLRRARGKGCGELLLARFRTKPPWLRSLALVESIKH